MKNVLLRRKSPYSGPKSTDPKAKNKALIPKTIRSEDQGAYKEGCITVSPSSACGNSIAAWECEGECWYLKFKGPLSYHLPSLPQRIGQSPWNPTGHMLLALVLLELATNNQLHGHVQVMTAQRSTRRRASQLAGSAIIRKIRRDSISS